MAGQSRVGIGLLGVIDGHTCQPVEPDREQIERFVRAVFAEAPLNSIVTLRSFYDDGIDGPPYQSKFERLRNKSDLDCVIDTAFKMANAAATCARPVVFCPSLATYAKRTSKAADLAAGFALTVECDQRAIAAEQTLSAILGLPSFTIASGGHWLNPETGEVEDKLHLHWILAEPAINPEQHNKLRRLRELACDLVGADATSKAIVHPIRWPGTVHRKNKPRLSQIIREIKARIDLDEALAELEGLEVLRETINGYEQRESSATKPDAKPLSSDLLQGCAKRIPSDNLEWSEWNRIAMAFWGASNGDVAGFEAFSTWSGKSSKNNPTVTAARWQHFGASPPERIGAGTLVYLARQADPSFGHRRARPASEVATARPDVETGDEFEPLRNAITEINRSFFVVQIGGSVVIGTYVQDRALERDTLHFVKPSDFILKFRSRKFLVGYSQRGSEIWKPLGDAWLESPMRRQYDRAEMICNGECPPDTLNLWRGFGCLPVAGSWQTLAEHLLYIICAGNEDHYEYLIKLLARWVQHPDKPGEVAIVMRGKKGTGKGTVAKLLMRWFCHHAVHISQSKHLTGHFNAHLADCLLFFADEVVWGGDKQGDGVLKALVTERAVHIEPKGVNSFQMPNRLKIVMASNNDWAVPATADERRYLVFEVSAACMGDADYFNRLHAAIDGGEAEAMLQDLLNLDLTGFNHRDVPHTDGLNHQKMEGLDPIADWWMSCLSEGQVVGCETPGDADQVRYWPTDISKTDLYAAYRHHARDHGERHPKPEHRFPIRLKELAASLRDHKPHGQPRRWLLQSLEHHRGEFLEAMQIGTWDWSDPDDGDDDTVQPLRARF